MQSFKDWLRAEETMCPTCESIYRNSPPRGCPDFWHECPTCSGNGIIGTAARGCTDLWHTRRWTTQSGRNEPVDG